MRQTWCHLLFMHWRIDEALLAPLLPGKLELDLHDGSAWIGLIPFSMRNVRPGFGPPIRGLSSFGEVNLRTYVTYRGEPGVWFISLDASNPLAVWFARVVFHLPYFRASIRTSHDETRNQFFSRRSSRSGSPATFHAQWRPGAPLGRIKPGSLPWFLTERYRLFTSVNREIRTAEIRHDPWPLREATLDLFESTLFEAAGLPAPSGPPILHHSDELAVDVWPLRSPAQSVRRSVLIEPEGAPKPI